MFHNSLFRRTHYRVVALGMLSAITACDTAQLTADSTSSLFQRAAPALEQYWDYDLAGEAVPATIVQFEGILRIVPDNEAILSQLTRVYAAYAYGWIEADVEELEFEGQYDEADELRDRARIMYLRAMDLARQWIRVRNPGIDDALKGNIDELEAWLKANFKRKSQADKLFWAGYTWGAYINAAKDDMEAVADLPYAKAFVQRSIELNPGYYHAAGYTFLGVAEASQLAANLEQSKAWFDEALRTTDRRALLTLVNMARYYAVKTQDRELFDQLLSEVLDAGDVLPTARLSNRIARVRAQLYLDNADQLF